MPDNWGFVFTAYGLAAVVLTLYWRFLVRREKELDDAGVVRQQLRQSSSASGPQAAGGGRLP
ncbi:MAG TPA: hypothetical protein VKD88_07825 [Gaiellaceae bacterium]|nr:hypothetical protein [Gaiellaceae bacterium]